MWWVNINLVFKSGWVQYHILKVGGPFQCHWCSKVGGSNVIGVQKWVGPMSLVFKSGWVQYHWSLKVGESNITGL